MKKHQKQFLTLICIAVLLSGLNGIAKAACIGVDTPNKASDYLDYYAAWTSTGEKSEVIASFDVLATGYMKLVGAEVIVLQEKNGDSWTGVATYWGTVANGMLAPDMDEHAGSITYIGTSGKQYRALVTVYAEDSKGDDARTVITNTITAR